MFNYKYSKSLKINNKNIIIQFYYGYCKNYSYDLEN